MKLFTVFIIYLVLFLLLANHVTAKSYLPASNTAPVCFISTKLDTPRIKTATESALLTATSSAQVTWYGREACTANGTIYGSTCKTANGEVFSEDSYVFASRNIPFGVPIEFSYGNTRVVCKSADRIGNTSAVFDLSLACAKALGIVSRGRVVINYKFLE
jgi:rare lipoprotein A (peptidoglycan hydrolase)